MPCSLWRPCALLLSVLPGTAVAGPAAEAAIAPATVAVLAATCVSCHGPGGHSGTDIPSIAGQSESRLRARLLAFRNGTAPDATIMTRLMKGYDEAQIAALARWFAQERQ